MCEQSSAVVVAADNLTVKKIDKTIIIPGLLLNSRTNILTEHEFHKIKSKESFFFVVVVVVEDIIT